MFICADPTILMVMRRADSTDARLDVAYWADGVRRFVDGTIRHPRAQKHLAAAARTDGAAAAEAERNKRIRYWLTRPGSSAAFRD